MHARKPWTVAIGLFVVASIPFLLGQGCPTPTGDIDTARISQGRMNAARALAGGTIVRVDLLQRDPTPAAMQDPCDPLGIDPLVAGNQPWDSRLPAGAVNLSLAALLQPIPVSEYDFLVASPGGETEYILSLRVIDPAIGLLSPHFTSVEFNFRAVNPSATGHALGANYTIGQAKYPSNEDDDAANNKFVDARSLIDLGSPDGGDVAIVVRGLGFTPLLGPISNTAAHMNALGPMAWVAFMRDNAFQSGRFFNLRGVWTGGPRALEDIPGMTGVYQSAQINGDTFDTVSENGANMDAVNFQVCAAAPTQPYAFMDYSNLDQNGAAAPGRGGFIWVMRDEAWKDPAANGIGVGLDADSTTIVIDPSTNPFNPPAFTNIITAPDSGYDEPIVPGINGGASETDNSGVGEPGAHELSVAVFFIHT